MSIIFNTSTSQRVIMLDRDAEIMLKTIHTSGSVPGALYPEAIPAAIEALEARIKLESHEEESAKTEDSDAVDMQTRAFPLIELMHSAIEKNETLMWDEGNKPFNIIK